MGNKLFIGLIYNTSLLLVLVAVYSGIRFEIKFKSTLHSRLKEFLIGVLVGFIGIAVMANPWTLEPGIILDARSILLGATGLFFGVIPTALAVLITGAFRLFLDGTGALSGLCVILTSSGLGLLWQHYRPGLNQKGGWFELYLFGISVHILMLACFFLLPLPLALEALRRLSLPVLAIYPAGTALLGILLIHQRDSGRRETELWESEQLFRKIFENHSAVKFILDPDTGTIVDANEAAARFYGWSREQLKRMKVQDINTLAPEAAGVKLKQAADGSQSHFESRHRRADGSVRDVEVFSGNICGKGKNLIHSIVHDITERKLAETALAENGAKYRALFDQARDSILLLEMPSEGIPIIGDANAAALILHGYSREELIGKPISFLDAETSESLTKEWVSRIRGSTGALFEARHRRKDGSLIDVEASVREIPIGEKRVLLDISRDITGRKAAEQEREKLQGQLLQSQKIEVVGRLAGGVAHDFNNILTVIKFYGGLIRNGFTREDPRRADAQEILNASDRAASLTRQLLIFSRRQVTAPKVLDLNKLLGDMVKMLCRLIGEDVRLETKLSGAPCLVLADPSQVEQVVMNLAVNARDAMPKGGTITFETGIVSPDGEFSAAHPALPRGPLVCLTARDTGSGMTAEVRSHAFEPFFTTKPAGSGTGLGLATILGIVKQSGGGIELETGPGKGTSFYIYLPLAAAAGPAVEKVSDRNAPLRGRETVLLAEDDQTMRRMIERLLRSSGYTVITAADGPGALEALERGGKPVDLLLTDVVMPGMSGRELAREVARRKLSPRTLYMSGYTDETIAKHGVLDTGLAFIYKPFTVEELSLKLREVLEGPADRARA